MCRYSFYFAIKEYKMEGLESMQILQEARFNN